MEIIEKYLILWIILSGIIFILSIISFFLTLSNKNNIGKTTQDLNKINQNLTDKISSMSILLKKIPSIITTVGGDSDKPLSPLDVINMIGYGNVGIIQQHLDIPANFGYGNVLTTVPQSSGYISQIWLSTIYNEPVSATKNMYIRYSNKNITDIKDKTSDWGAWTKMPGN